MTHTWPISCLRCICWFSLVLKLTWTDVNYSRLSQYFFFNIEDWSNTRYWLDLCHSWFHLHGVSLALRNLKEARITKWKCLAHSGIWSRYLPLTKRRRYQLCHEIWCCGGLYFRGYQISWLSWRVRSTKSSTNQKMIFCMNYEGKC